VLVPATLAALLAEPGFAAADLSGLRAVTTGSTYVPQALIDPFERRGVPVLQVYGATETCPISIYTRLGGPRPEGSTGWPGPFCEAKIVDDAGRDLPDGASGEIWVRGPQILSGYWRDEAATAASLTDGWFRTGDIATRDATGAYYVHDRKKNVVISGGENIYPAEIERVLLEHAAVAECAGGRPPRSALGGGPGRACRDPGGRILHGRALSAHVLAQLARLQGAEGLHLRGKPAKERARQGAAPSLAGAHVMRIAVLGGGNGSFAAAGDFALAGHEVRLWRRDGEAIADSVRSGSAISSRTMPGRHEAKLALATADIAAAVDGAELILCPAPAFAQGRHRATLAPNLRPGQVVFLPPATFGTMIFAEAARRAGTAEGVAFAETGTLPWLARKHGPREVAITVRAKHLPVGTFPASASEWALDVIGRASRA
jgi:acyl-CoA synthetase (AMP-forming)/AMP-acid ligase II